MIGISCIHVVDVCLFGSGGIGKGCKGVDIWAYFLRRKVFLDIGLNYISGGGDIFITVSVSSGYIDSDG